MEKETRYLCWDKKLIDTARNLEVRMHRPEPRNAALVCDDDWEGVTSGYACVIPYGGEYRMYYRGCSVKCQADGKIRTNWPTICMAVSRDGKTFEKPNLGRYEYDGTKDNNIVFMSDRDLDNFSVFLDRNPACPADERFKALSEKKSSENPGLRVLEYYASADGIDFRFMRALPVRGLFDSYNVAFWDEKRKTYFLYYRAMHRPDGTDIFDRSQPIRDRKDFRDVRVATSPDFVRWTEHGRITFEPGQPDCAIYTNQIAPYFDTGVFMGFPVRYCNRADEAHNFDFMPLADRHRMITRLFGREGTAVTDCVVMTSADGRLFDRRDEAYLTPGVEARDNWWYGDCYTVYGMVKTASEIPGAPDEISMYVGENYRIRNVVFRRLVTRTDGFFSWYGGLKGGTAVTKPIEVGGAMCVNFATSAAGGLTVSLLGEDGKAIDGYESGVLFGDSVERPVEFEKPLGALAGRKVRIRFRLCDCHLYSFSFRPEK